MGLEIAATSAAASATGIPQAIEARRARRQEKRARRAERRIQDIRAARERRRTIREARIQRANIEAGAQAAGTAATSGAVIGAATVGTQLASNLSFLDTVSDLQEKANIFRERAANARGRQQDYEALGRLTRQGASLFTPGGGA